METTIIGMIQGNVIYVMDHHPAYSWNTWKKDSDLKGQVNTFLDDLMDYLKSEVKTPYSFGHFLYEKTEDYKYAIIDGQQRLTTIIMLVSTLFYSIGKERLLTEKEEEIYEYVIKRRGTYRFSTVKYDNKFFRDYVIDNVITDRHGIETASGLRIADACDFFRDRLQTMDLPTKETLLYAVVKASCTTHIVNGELKVKHNI